MFIDYTVTKDCINHHSYGEICVKCNCCGRFDSETVKTAQIEYYKEYLENELHFDRWDDDFREVQEKNVKANIEYFKNKLKELGADEQIV